GSRLLRLVRPGPRLALQLFRTREQGLQDFEVYWLDQVDVDARELRALAVLVAPVTGQCCNDSVGHSNFGAQAASDFEPVDVEKPDFRTKSGCRLQGRWPVVGHADIVSLKV